MKAEKLIEYLDVFAHESFEEMDRYWPNKNCCVAATKIGIAVFDAFGVDAVPLPCEMIVHNGPASEFLLENHRLPTRDERPNAMSVCIGAKASPCELGPNDWNGHLVMFVEGRFLVDLTASQAMELAGKDSGIVLDATIIDVAQTPGFEAAWEKVGIEGLEEVVGFAKPCIVRYRPRLDATDYTDAIAWQQPRAQRPHIERIIAALEKRGFKQGQFSKQEETCNA